MDKLFGKLISVQERLLLLCIMEKVGVAIRYNGGDIYVGAEHILFRGQEISAYWGTELQRRLAWKK